MTALTTSEQTYRMYTEALQDTLAWPDYIHALSTFLPTVRLQEKEANNQEWNSLVDDRGHILDSEITRATVAFDQAVERQEQIREQYTDTVYLLCTSPIVLKMDDALDNLLSRCGNPMVQALVDKIQNNDAKVECIWSGLWNSRKMEGEY